MHIPNEIDLRINKIFFIGMDMGVVPIQGTVFQLQMPTTGNLSEKLVS
jgi:hypothetical protein